MLFNYCNNNCDNKGFCLKNNECISPSSLNSNKNSTSKIDNNNDRKRFIMLFFLMLSCALI